MDRLICFKTLQAKPDGVTGYHLILLLHSISCFRVLPDLMYVIIQTRETMSFVKFPSDFKNMIVHIVP